MVLSSKKNKKSFGKKEFRVLIIYRFLPHYRVDFYNNLKNKLAIDNINLDLIYGKKKNEDRLKMDEVDLAWARYIPNKIIKLGTKQFYWQSCLSELRKYDLIIVEQANKLLINYLLMLLSRKRYTVTVRRHGVVRTFCL